MYWFWPYFGKKGGNYSRVTIIQGRILIKEIRYALKLQLTPEAVRTGLALSFGIKVFLWSWGTAAIMSTNLGWLSIAYFEDSLVLILFRLTSLPSWWATISSLIISLMQRTSLSSRLSLEAFAERERKKICNYCIVRRPQIFEKSIPFHTTSFWDITIQWTSHHNLTEKSVVLVS